MYTPPAYAEDDLEHLHALMREWSFATVVSNGGEDGPMATHLPVLLDEGGPEGLGVLTTHMARNNPQWETLEGRNALVIFQGPHAFVSVNWYDNRKTFPTWNYGAIHAYGRVRLERDPETLRALLVRTIATFDIPDGEWRFAEMPEDMIAPRLRAIVGLEIGVTRLEGKLKFNQDKSAADRVGVRAALSVRPAGREAAAFMGRLERRSGKGE